MTGTIARAGRLLAALLLLLLASVLVLMAFQERDLGATLESLALPGATPDTPRGQYELAFWVHLVMAALQAGIAFGVVRFGNRTWFALGALTSALATVSAVWMMWPVVTPMAPMHLGGLLPIALLVAGGTALLASIVGWLMSPPLAPLKPSVPFAPSNHQA